MRSKEEELAFIEAMRSIDYTETVETLEDAICVAMTMVPQTNGIWFGELANGVYYGDDEQSLWFPGKTLHEASLEVLKELMSPDNGV